MISYERISTLIDKIYENKKSEYNKEVEFCCGTLGIYEVFSNNIIKIIKGINTNLCEVTRVKSDVPVIYRDERGNIFRCHSEICYLIKEMIKLASLDEREYNLNPQFEYDK